MVAPSPGDHYFSATPATRTEPMTVELVLPDVRLRLVTDRGVFAREGVDAGTKYLLLDGPMPSPTAPATLVDLGCGYGPIALALAARCPAARVWAVDVNERARRLCAANAAAAGLANVTVVEPSNVPADLMVDRLFSNPPIRIGKVPLQRLLTDWLARLAPDGLAVLVVHKHLGSDSLATWLAAEGWRVHRLGSRLGYRLLTVEPEP